MKNWTFYVPLLASYGAGLAGLKARDLSAAWGLCRCRGRCRAHDGCLGCGGGTVVPLLDDVDPVLVPLPGIVPGALGLPRQMAQYHS